MRTRSMSQQEVNAESETVQVDQQAETAMLGIFTSVTDPFLEDSTAAVETTAELVGPGSAQEIEMPEAGENTANVLPPAVNDFPLENPETSGTGVSVNLQAEEQTQRDASATRTPSTSETSSGTLQYRFLCS